MILDTKKGQKLTKFPAAIEIIFYSNEIDIVISF
jgi:hypothetical protein